MVGVERGCLVPITLQRPLGGWSGWQEDRAEDLDWSIWGWRASAPYGCVTSGQWLNHSGPSYFSSEKQGEWYIPLKAAPGAGPGPGWRPQSARPGVGALTLAARVALMATQRHLLTDEKSRPAPASPRPFRACIFEAAMGARLKVQFEGRQVGM